MPEQGFGAGLWRNVRAIKLGPDGGIEAPVRANDRDGIVVGVGHVAETEAAGQPKGTPTPHRHGWWARRRRRGT
jgi:hypothetical protein